MASTTPARKRRFGLIAGAGLLAMACGWLVCCQAPERRTHGPQPVAETPTPADETPSQPAPSRMETPPPEPDAPPPAEPPAEVKPVEENLPDYLRIVDVFREGEQPRVEYRIESPRRLVIDTHNVQRLRIERSQLPMQTRGSIVLQLDGQGIEWTASSTTVEFERSANGDWQPVRQP